MNSIIIPFNAPVTDKLKWGLTDNGYFSTKSMTIWPPKTYVPPW